MSRAPERIKSRRLELGLSQEALARRVNVGVRSVQRWETGEVTPSVPLAVRLAEALGTDLVGLFSDDAA